MFDRLIRFVRRSRARSFNTDASEWYKTCQTITNAFREVLADEHIGRGEIGVVLDRVDRQLFGLRNSLHGLRRPLKRRNSALARRVDKVTEQVFRLRNKAASFMIRAQGPTPGFLDSAKQSGDASWPHYYKALEEQGFEARAIAQEVAAELEAIWDEMQAMIVEVENSKVQDSTL